MTATQRTPRLSDLIHRGELDGLVAGISLHSDEMANHLLGQRVKTTPCPFCGRVNRFPTWWHEDYQDGAYRQRCIAICAMPTCHAAEVVE